MVLIVQVLDQGQGAIKITFHDNERDQCPIRITGRVQLGSVDDVSRS